MRTVALRISRVNHNCNPNAGTIYDDNARVQILFANRVIQPGEEICISYSNFSSVHMGSDSEMDPQLRFQLLKNKLKSSWGIVCPADCFCNDDAIKSLLIKGQELHKQYSALGYCHPKLAQPAAALKVADNLFEVLDRVQASLLSRVSAHYDAFQIGAMSRDTLPQACKHIGIVHDIFASICPYSSTTIKYEQEMKDPTLAMNYCGRLAKYN
jgi:hypothetical protein